MSSLNAKKHELVTSLNGKFTPSLLSKSIASVIFLVAQLPNSAVASTNVDGSLGLGRSSCMVTSSGTVQCWGNNNYGQLGNGTVTNSGIPVTVTGLSNVKAVAVGSLHACALTNVGTVWCWGQAAEGQLGNTTTVMTSGAPTIYSSLPVQVTGLNNIISISSGGSFSCVLDSIGTVKCWGLNSSGQLGSGTSSPTSNSATPVSVSGLTGIVSLSSGSAHSCALNNVGIVKCWGYNGYGQLGNGTEVSSSVPVSVSGLSGVTAISSGNANSCAIVNTGELKCWGDNGYGQLGNGTTISSKVPVLVTGLNNLKTVTVGGGHVCVLTNTGEVKCWGENYDGQLGNGTTVNSNLPVSTGLTGITSLAAGDLHSCALTTTTCEVKCWGRNTDGQLGNATTTNSATAVSVTNATPKCSTTGGGTTTTSTTECGNPAKYDAATRIATIPAVDLPVLDPLTGKASSQMATFSCNLQQSAGVDDFKVDAASLKFVAMTPSHLVQNALFEASTNEFDTGGKLTMCVQVPNVVITPLGVTSLPPSNYRVIMRQLAIQPDTLHIESIQPLP